jgi:hypothetical protein
MVSMVLTPVTPVVIRFVVVPAPAADKVARANEEKAAVAEVRRALFAYTYMGAE